MEKMSFEISLLIPLICIANAIDSNIIINSAAANICNYQTNLSCQNCTQEFVPFMNKCEACGTTKFASNARIVGGVIANTYSWPAEVFILIKISGDFNLSNTIFYNITQTFACGGTLINFMTVVSAAHCFNWEFKYVNGFKLETVNVKKLVRSNYQGPFDVEIYAGASNTSSIRNGITPPAPAVKLTVLSVKIHEDYVTNPDNYLNDIALITLANPVELNDYIQLACLPNILYGSYPPINSSAIAVGRGTLNESGSRVQDILYNVRLTTYDPSYCSTVEISLTKDWNRQLCVGEYSGGKDSCYGDSGGGLYVYDSNTKKNILVGIISYNEGCGRVSKPGIYTRVSYYLDWIAKNWIKCDKCQSLNSTRSLATNNILHSALFYTIILVTQSFLENV